MENFTEEFLVSKKPKLSGGSTKKKSQENDSSTLLESQENVFQKISAVLSQSSQSTYVGELEETLVQSTKKQKPVRKKQRLTKKSTNETTGQPEQMDCSQGSVSMLQECYNNPEFPEIMDTYPDTEEVVNIYTDDELDEEPVWKCESVTTDVSTQTDSEPAHKDEEMEKHSQFIQSVIRLKTVTSSKNAVSSSTISSILRKNDAFAEYNCEIPKETVDYVLRSSNVDSVFRDTVLIVLRRFERVLNEDFFETALCWKNSVYENVVDMLVDAVENEVGVRRDVDLFVCKNIEGIANVGTKSKNFLLESKTNFIISLCRSTHLSYTSITHSIEQLKNLKQISRRSEASYGEKLCTTNKIKSFYFLLRILEASLEFFKGKVVDGAIEKTLVKETETKTYNVLKMWQKHWTRDERKEDYVGHVWEKYVSEWCDELDEVSLHCVNNFPLLSVVVERCATLAKHILTMCHPEWVRSQRQTAPNPTEYLDDIFED